MTTFLLSLVKPMTVGLALLLVGASAMAQVDPNCVPATAAAAPLTTSQTAPLQTAADAAQAADAGGRQIPHAVVRLEAGSLTGLEASLFIAGNRNANVAVESFVGATGLTFGYGGGLRVELRPVGGDKNALLVSPAFDVYYAPADTTGLFEHPDEVLLQPNMDVKWLHQFNQSLGLELGVRGGYMFTVNESQGGTSGSATVQALTGLRF